MRREDRERPVINLCQHGMAPSSLLFRRLEALTGPTLDAPDLALDGPRRTIAAGEDLFAGGPAACYLVASGVAADARVLSDGRRQILGLRLPGDIVQGDAYETVTALTAVEVVDATPLIGELNAATAHGSGLRRAWLAALRAEQGMLRDHVVRLGRLSAYERLAHLLVEVHDRLFHVGLASATSFHFPLRQEMIADMLGLSVVHVSRTSQQLRRDRLAQTRSSYVNLLDREGLSSLAQYTSRFPFTPAVAPPARLGPVEVRSRYAAS